MPNSRGDRLLIIAFVAVVFVDVLFVFLHSQLGWSVINLDEEGNLTAWYSSSKLLALAFLCLLIWSLEGKVTEGAIPFRWLWLVVAAVFLLLSADETASLHERLARTIMEDFPIGLDIRETLLGGDRTKDSFAWVFLLSPFILVVTIFFLLFFFLRLKRCPSALLFAVGGVVLFLLVVALESTIYFLPAMRDWGAGDLARYRSFLAFEESGELLGSSMFLMAFARYARFIGMDRDPPPRAGTGSS